MPYVICQLTVVVRTDAAIHVDALWQLITRQANTRTIEVILKLNDILISGCVAKTKLDFR